MGSPLAATRKQRVYHPNSNENTMEINLILRSATAPHIYNHPQVDALPALCPITIRRRYKKQRDDVLYIAVQ